MRRMIYMEKKNGYGDRAIPEDVALGFMIP
jgi:hypothetical protein